MSTFLYDHGRHYFLIGGIDWVVDTIKTVLLDLTHYTVSQSADANLSDISGSAIVGTAVALTSLADFGTAGIADADDATLTSVSGGASGAVLIYKDTGTGSTSRLIAYIDNYTGLPVTPNGGNITISWPNDANRIFKL